MDREVVGVVSFGMIAMVAVDVVLCSAVVVVVVVVVQWSCSCSGVEL